MENSIQTNVFNPETNIDKKKHNVVLKDTQRQLLLIGFEDINRESGSDEDFNDGIFLFNGFSLHCC